VSQIKNVQKWYKSVGFGLDMHCKKRHLNIG
jgi:hypothetical protein